MTLSRNAEATILAFLTEGKIPHQIFIVDDGAGTAGSSKRHCCNNPRAQPNASPVGWDVLVQYLGVLRCTIKLQTNGRLGPCDNFQQAAEPSGRSNWGPKINANPQIARSMRCSCIAPPSWEIGRQRQLPGYNVCEGTFSVCVRVCVWVGMRA